MTDSKPPSRLRGRPLMLVGPDTGVVDRLMAGREVKKVGIILAGEATQTAMAHAKPVTVLEPDPVFIIVGALIIGGIYLWRRGI